MLHSTELEGAPRQRRWRRYAVLSVLGTIIVAAGVYARLFVRVVPPLFGQVVDAVTGKPVKGMSVCLEAGTYAFGYALGHRRVLRSEVATTDASGRFSFWPSALDMAMLETWDGYSIRVTDPRTDFAALCGPNLGPGLNEVHPDQFLQVQGDGTEYLPVSLVRQGESLRNDVGWSSTRRPITSTWKMRVPLVPVLSNVGECKLIQDTSLAEDCRRLNAEAMATELNNK
jgi:hypothetical protein